jgi:hypothetical protein
MKWCVVCSDGQRRVEELFSSKADAEQHRQRLDSGSTSGYESEPACAPHRVERAPNPMYVGRPPGKVSEMTDEELDAWGEEVIEEMRRDR